MIGKITACIAAITLPCIFPTLLLAKDYKLSNQPIFISNEYSRCISRNDDKFSLLLKGVRFQKEDGLFVEDTKIGIAIGATPHVSGQTIGFSPYEFTVLREVDLKNAEEGFIQDSGAQGPIMNLFDLKAGTGTVSRISYGLKVIKTRGKGDAVQLAQHIFESAKSIEFPPNPYSTPAIQVATVINGFIDGLIASDTGKDIVIGSSNVSMGFNLNGDNCDPYDDARTGYTLFLFEPNGRTDKKIRDHFISIDRAVWANLCFKVDPASNRPQFAEKKNGSCPAPQSAEYRNLFNPYVLFYVRAEPKQSAETTREDLKNLTSLWATAEKLETPKATGTDDPTYQAFKKTAKTLKSEFHTVSLSMLSNNKDLDRSVRECEAYGLNIFDCFDASLGYSPFDIQQFTNGTAAPSNNLLTTFPKLTTERSE
ncbi:hypothetical protein [Sneathiella chinensis]|uniref:Uncharacterized protein n=1 Tax=Sneathiella chinensis TaxID=349750 RepID=A0ABQ5U6E9_9PROT|nr:hypothetical protein [Sneathiella chinensis]GLQ07351.1 hypothetical protein GCM10007924_25720 [Sneathiella chinensis]